ncbi:MAG: exo-alpha-sialidase [Sphingobacteriales bacterium]|nr:exo-alpha-sialidase [Sphingobacteriales bacterium]
MMKTKILFLRLCCTVIVFAQLLFIALAQGNPGISITAVQVPAPLLKGLPANPLVRLDIVVKPGDHAISLGKIYCTLNAAAVRSLEKVEIFASGPMDEFLNARRFASVTPSSATLEIPLAAPLPPGMHRLWVSAVIKNDANADDIIDLRVTHISTDLQRYAVAQAPASFKRHIGVAIRKKGDDKVNTYRIPGMITTNKGTLLAVYDVRYNNSKDLPENIDVGLSRSTDGGKTWEPMKIIMDMGEPHENNGIGDPSILFDPVTKKIWVAALWSKGNRSIAGSEPGLSPDTTGQFVLVSSDDDGLTWSAPHSITSQVKDPAWHLYFQGPGSGIAMQNGTLVFPSQYWDEQKKPGIPHSAIIYSEDHGKTWKSGTGAKSNTTEAQVVETRPGTLMLNMRDNRGMFRSVATTDDMGKTWREHHSSRSALPDPVCMGSFIKAEVNVKGKMKEVLFFSNPNSGFDRYNMTIKASMDMGETWLPAHQLLVDERGCYGYSTLTKIDDNMIGILYEGTGDLYFIRIPVNEIIK